MNARSYTTCREMSGWHIQPVVCCRVPVGNITLLNYGVGLCLWRPWRHSLAYKTCALLCSFGRDHSTLLWLGSLYTHNGTLLVCWPGLCCSVMKNVTHAVQTSPMWCICFEHWIGTVMTGTTQVLCFFGSDYWSVKENVWQINYPAVHGSMVLHSLLISGC